MGSTGFAVVLIVGIAFFATGIGGLITLGMVAVGALGLVASAFGPSNKRR